MKILTLTILCCGLWSAGQAFAGDPVHVGSQNGFKEFHHSGGCRKSSPPGQCCHAGSEPYHCH